MACTGTFFRAEAAVIAILCGLRHHTGSASLFVRAIAEIAGSASSPDASFARICLAKLFKLRSIIRVRATCRKLPGNGMLRYGSHGGQNAKSRLFGDILQLHQCIS